MPWIESPDTDRRRFSHRVLTLAVGGALGLPLLAGCSDKKVSFKSTDVTGADYGKTLNLTDAVTGKVRSLDEFRGQVVMLFFGFTHCPDICPTTLLKARDVRKALGAQGSKLQVLFVTVDPERDTPEVMARYVAAFDPSFIGLRGDEAETRRATREFKVFHQKVPNRDGSSYTVDHTAASYIIDAQGQLRLFVRHAQPVEEITADLKALLATG